MSKVSISVGAIMLLGAGMVASGQGVDPSTPIPPAPVKNSSAPAEDPSGLAPKQAEGRPRPAAATKRKAGAPQAAPGVSPQAPQMVNGRPTAATPPTKQDATRAQQEAAEAFRYRGTAVVPHRKLDPKDERVKAACELLSRADFVPATRIQSFSGLRPRYAIVGWRLTVHQLEERQDGTIVRAWVTPLLKAKGEGAIGVMAFYGETYRIAGGKLEFIGGDPITADPPIMMGGGQ